MNAKRGAPPSRRRVSLESRLSSSSVRFKQISPITHHEFLCFQKLISDETGIWLPESKKGLLVGRLGKRLRALGLNSYGEYFALVSRDSNHDERLHMIDCICTNETQFFREKRHFRFLEEKVLPEIKQRARRTSHNFTLRVWSAACSTGEEPYSLAMLFLDRFRTFPHVQIEILASDLSTRALEKAREGIWPIERAAQIPPELLSRYMLRGKRGSEGLMKASRKLRSVIKFERINLTAADISVPERFDLVFCCNVLMYFSANARAAVVDKLTSCLAPNGLLFVGHAESLIRNMERLRSVVPNVYARSSGRAKKQSA